MNYDINPKVYRNIFGVPADVADKHIKLASHAALKVMLYIMRNGTESVDESTHKALGISQTELDEAFIYWTQVGLFTDNKVEANIQPAKPITESPAIIRNEHPDRAEVARRISESEEIAHVLRQSESVYGRTLKPAEMSSIIYIMDSLGLKASVTLMLVQYANAEGKLSTSFLESTAVRWANEGIASVSAAEKEMQAADIRRSAWKIVCRAMGIESRRPSKKEEEASTRWVNEWAFSDKMLRRAYDECVDHSGKLSIPYINTILENWHKAGIDTPEKLEGTAVSTPSKTAKPVKKKNPATSDNPSFDINLFEQMLNGKKGD